MAQTLFIISPSTQEILPYQYQPTDTFAPIIADLQARNKPTNLLYYNGVQSTPIKPEYQILPFFPHRISQVVIYAFGQPKQPFPILTIPAGYILVLILKWDLSQLIPLYLPVNTTINTIINYFQKTYDWIVSLTKQTGQRETVLLNQLVTLAEVLPKRTEQILLKLEDQSLVVQQLAQLQDLPNELVIQVLLQLPIASLTTICRLSKRLAQFCHDEDLWHQLVVRDFGLKTKPNFLQNKSWQDIYQIKTFNDPDNLLVKGAELGDKLIIKNAIDAEATDWFRAIVAAARQGHNDIVNEIVEEFVEMGFEITSLGLLKEAASNGEIELIRWIFDVEKPYEWEVTNDDLNDIIIIALDKAQDEEISSNRYKEIIKLMIKVLKERGGHIDEQVFINALEMENWDIAKIIFDALIQNGVKIYPQLLVQRLKPETRHRAEIILKIFCTKIDK